MHRIDDPSAAPGGLFTEGDPVTSVPGTVVTADWLNSVQEEIANVIQGAGDALDKPDNAQLLAAIQVIAIAAAPTPFRTGDVQLTMRPTAEAGWIVCNDGSIGNAGSAGSTRTNADCEALFALLWDNVSDALAPVSGGRGASAAADWAANKTIGLTKMLGRSLGVAGNGAGLTARTLGQAVGAETHLLIVQETPLHVHGYGSSVPVAYSGGGADMYVGAGGGGSTTMPSGNDQPHNNMQPTAFIHAHIKL